jgi:hypothetical protein
LDDLQVTIKCGRIGALVALLLGFPAIGLASDHGQIPDAWGVPTDQRIANSECPLVGGTYDVESGERIRTVERGAVDDTGPAGWRMLFRHPRVLEKSVKTETAFQNGVGRHYLEISQPSPDKLRVSRTFIDGKGIVTYHFDRDLGDFDCRDGFILLKPIVTDQTGYFSKNTSRFTRTKDGPLVYYEKIEGQRTEMIFFSSSALVHHWYRFRPRMAE